MNNYHRLMLASLAASLGAASAVAAPVETPGQAATTAETQLDIDGAAASAAAASSTAALAQPESADEQGDWTVSFTPYIWAAGTNGDIGIPRGDSVEIDKSFFDTLSNLEFAFMGAFDIRYRRFVALGDIIYLSAKAEAEGIREPQFFEGEVDSSVFMGMAALGYRVVDNGPQFVDIFAGGRVVSLDVEVELEGPLQTRRREASSTNWSPLIGARAHFPLSEDWAIGVYGDFGGILDSSDVKWQLFGSVQYNISRHWRLVGGYRYLSINHDTERLDFDIGMSGPLIGVTYTF
jgi:opacity protein-like surface antigen